MARLLTSFLATVTVSGPCTFMRAYADELRLSSWDTAGRFLATATTVSDTHEAMIARIRWNRPLLYVEGQPVLRERYGDITLEDELVPSQFRTMEFSALGKPWTFFDSVSVPVPPFQPCDPAPGEEQIPRRKAWGNRRVDLLFSAGRTSAQMREVLAFGGLTFSKDNVLDVGITAQIHAVDLSLQVADFPLCFSLDPFSGFYRGEILRALAREVGFEDDQIFVPLGRVCTKPILLNNASLLPFANEFGEVENWFSYVDDAGNFRTEEIVLKEEQPDWIHDARLGDIDLDSFEERLPERAPNRYYVSATFPIKNTGVLDNPLAQTVKEITSEFGFYNPLVIKVRPSGLPSVLQPPDGGGAAQYRAFPAQEFMEVGRLETEKTTIDGILAHEVIRTWGMYNPLAYDPNYDNVPATTSYNGAYGDKSFHRDEIESLMVVAEEVTENRLDEFGTLLGTDVTSQAWYAPKRGILYNTTRTNPKNFPAATPPAYIFPDTKGVTARQIPVEIFQVIQRTTKDLEYNGDGTLKQERNRRYRITDPQSRSDIIADPALPPNASPPPPTTADPLPGSTGGIALYLTISGPTRHEGDRFFFQITMPPWVDQYFVNTYGVHPHALTLESGVTMPALTYLPRNGRAFVPLPGAEGTKLFYSPGQVIDPSATPQKLTAEIYVDIPHVPPLVLSTGFGPITNLFDGSIYLWTITKFEHLTGQFATLGTDFMPKNFTAYPKGSWPTRGI